MYEAIWGLCGRLGGGGGGGKQPATASPSFSNLLFYSVTDKIYLIIYIKEHWGYHYNRYNNSPHLYCDDMTLLGIRVRVCIRC